MLVTTRGVCELNNVARAVRDKRIARLPHHQRKVNVEITPLRQSARYPRGAEIARQPVNQTKAVHSHANNCANK